MASLARLAAAACLAALASCTTLDYDLSGVPVPISAKPEPAGEAEVTPFRIEEKHVMWLHGLAGTRQPDVAALVAEAARDHDRVADLRVSTLPGVGHWVPHEAPDELARLLPEGWRASAD